MDWPNTPIESRDDFEPPFCPRRSCSDHVRDTPGYRFQRWGSYSTVLEANAVHDAVHTF